MQSIVRKSRAIAASVALGIAVSALCYGPAAAVERVRFTLASSIDGRSGPIFLAVDRGHFAAEGLQADIVPGNGSANIVGRLASGAFPIGIGDIASIIKFNALNPDKRVKVIYNLYPADLAFVSLKGRGITKAEDLRGRRIGAPVGDSAYRMFPAFSAATGIAASELKWEHMNMSVREVMLIQGKVDAITATGTTALFSLKSAGVKESDIVFIRYADYGINLVGNGLMASEALIKARPDFVRSIVRALNRGWMDSIANPEVSVDAALKREPLLKRDIELERLKDNINRFANHQDARTDGVGFFSDATMAYSIKIIASSENLTNPMAPSDIMDTSLLPPRSERMVPARQEN